MRSACHSSCSCSSSCASLPWMFGDSIEYLISLLARDLPRRMVLTTNCWHTLVRTSRGGSHWGSLPQQCMPTPAPPARMTALGLCCALSPPSANKNRSQLRSVRSSRVRSRSSSGRHWQGITPKSGRAKPKSGRPSTKLADRPSPNLVEPAPPRKSTRPS